jgi:hypothetical protein
MWMLIIPDLFLQTSEAGVTEHIEGDECKFAVWTGRAPMMSDQRIVLKASSLEAKQSWVKKLREVIQETFFGSVMPIGLPRSPARTKGNSQRTSRYRLHLFIFFLVAQILT